MRQKTVILVSFLLMLYIAPSILYVTSYHTATLTEPNTKKEFQVSSDPLWLAGWGYRKNITLNQVVSTANPACSGTYYAVKFNIEWGSERLFVVPPGFSSLWFHPGAGIGIK